MTHSFTPSVDSHPPIKDIIITFLQVRLNLYMENNTVEWSSFVLPSSNLKQVFNDSVPIAPCCQLEAQIKPQTVAHPEKHFLF